MRQRLFFISLALIIFSIASGLGLRYALAIAWTEPSALPPGDNVSAPINVGAGAQIKTGDLTIGGNFSVSSGEVVGAPAGGNMGVGTLNAEQLCIQGNCRLNWPEAVNAFVDEGNVGFGPTAVLGTNDNVPLSLETNGVGRMMIGAAGNVGIGTTNTAFNLMVGGVAPRIYLLPAPGSNPELDFGSPAIDTHWAIYRDTGTDQLRFWRAGVGETNRLIIASDGSVGIGTTIPAFKLDVAGQINANINLTPAIQGFSSAGNGKGVYGEATAAAGINYGVHGKTLSATNFARGVYGEAAGAGNVVGVYGEATNGGAVTNVGGFFTAAGSLGIGVKGNGVSYGGFFQAGGAGGSAVYGEAGAADGWGGYFTGGQGLYTSSGVVGVPAGGYKGPGALNAVQLCIQGNCLGAWPAGVAPGGGEGQIQFNDGGAFTGDAGLTFDKVADILTVGGNLKIGMGVAGNDDYIYFDDGTKYIKWVDTQAMFNFSNGILSDSFVSGTQLTARSGGYIHAVDVTNGKSMGMRHLGTYGLLQVDSANPGVDAGNLVLRADIDYPANYVEIADELQVNSTLTVVGNATVLGKNVCLQDGTNCPGAAAAVQLQAATPGVVQVGHLNISGTGIFGGLQVGALNGVLKAAGGVVSGVATTSDLPEGANLYFTNERARAVISVGDGPLGYNPATGVIGFSSPLSFLYGGTGTGVLGPAGAVVYNAGGPYAFTAVGVAGQFLKSQGAGAPVWADVPSGVSGSGTTNYLTKFTAGTTLGNSQIIDTGTSAYLSGNFGIGWSPLSSVKLDVNGGVYIGGNLGLGTYSPSYKIHAVGDIFASGSLIGSAATISGDLVANNNTPSGCAWTAYAASVICPNGQFVAGIRYSASTVSAYCCEL